MLLEALQRLVDRHWDPAVSDRSTWAKMVSGLSDALFEAGFLDILVPDSEGRLPFDRQTLYQVARLCGQTLIPLPVGETILARSWAAAAGEPLPSTCWAMFGGAPVEDPSLLPRLAPAPTTRAKGPKLFEWNSEAGHLEPMEHSEASRIDGAIAPGEDALELSATALRSAWMAGALSRIAHMSLRHAAQREQFGRPIAAFQAVQHMLGQLVEEVAAAEAAAQRAFGSDEFDLPETAIARICCGMAAEKGAALAHQIHGAIGMTEAYPLSRYTRALAGWRQATQSESFWSIRLATHFRNSGLPGLTAWLIARN